MSDEEDKKKVNIEDLPVPLKELEGEEEGDVAGGLGGVSTTINPTNPTINPTNPTAPTNPINPLNPDIKNPTFNR